MVLSMGTLNGFSEPGLPGENDPFQYENLTGPLVRRLMKNRLAGLRNATLDAEPTHNDVVASHRSVYTNRVAARSSRLLLALHPAGGFAYSHSVNGAPTKERIASGALTDGTGKAMTTPGEMTQFPTGMLSAANGTSRFDIGRSNDIFVQMITLTDDDVEVGSANQFILRYTDDDNHMPLFRTTATNYEFQRKVAAATTAERNITIPATTPRSGNAIGIRFFGTKAAFFMNGVKYDEWTLNAAAQGLTGTNFGSYLGESNYSLLSYIEAWKLSDT